MIGNVRCRLPFSCQPNSESETNQCFCKRKRFETDQKRSGFGFADCKSDKGWRSKWVHFSLDKGATGSIFSSGDSYVGREQLNATCLVRRTWSQDSARSLNERHRKRACLLLADGGDDNKCETLNNSERSDVREPGCAECTTYDSSSANSEQHKCAKDVGNNKCETLDNSKCSQVRKPDCSECTTYEDSIYANSEQQKSTKDVKNNKYETLDNSECSHMREPDCAECATYDNSECSHMREPDCAECATYDSSSVNTNSEQQKCTKDIENWTNSDEEHINEIIQKSQWIEFEDFENIKLLSERGNASVYTATWRSGSTEVTPMKAVLKVIHAGANATAVFLNELAYLENATKSQKNTYRGFPIFYGVTKHAESGDYAFVMDYYQDGDVRTYIERNSNSLPWSKRLYMLRAIVRSLKTAHMHDIAHCNLHTGNLLFHSLPDSDACSTVISDFGLSKALASSVIGQPGSYGVIPYMAPELLTNRPLTLATDTYALGMIMWEISAGEPPFNDCNHDIYLKLSICDGARPSAVKGTPDCWIKLMERCWENNPENRPTLDDVEDEICRWSIDEQFEEAEKYRKDQPVSQRKQRHPAAHYSSRFISSITPPETNENWIDDEDWDQILAGMVLKD